MAKSFDEQFKDYYEKNKGEHDTEADIKAKEINYKDYFNQKLQNANLRALSQKYFRANMENSGLWNTGEMVSANLKNDQYYNNLDNANFENMQAKNNAITQQGITNYENGLNADIEKYIGYMQQFQGDKATINNTLKEYGLMDENGNWNDDALSVYGDDRVKDLKAQYAIATAEINNITDSSGNSISGVNFTADDSGASTIEALNNQTLGSDWSDFLNNGKSASTVLKRFDGVREEQKAMVNLINDGGNHENQIFLLSNNFNGGVNNSHVAYIYKNGSFYRLSPKDIIGKSVTWIKGGKVWKSSKTIESEDSLKEMIGVKKKYTSDGNTIPVDWRGVY